MPARQLTPVESELRRVARLGLLSFAQLCAEHPDQVTRQFPCLVELPAVRLRAGPQAGAWGLAQALRYELEEAVDEITQGHVELPAPLTQARVIALVGGVFQREHGSLTEARGALDPPDKPDRVRRTDEPWLYELIVGCLEWRGRSKEEHVGLVQPQAQSGLARFSPEELRQMKAELYEELYRHTEVFHHVLAVALEQRAEGDDLWRETALRALWFRSKPLPVSEKYFPNGLSVNAWNALGSVRQVSAVQAMRLAHSEWVPDPRQDDMLRYAAEGAGSSFYQFASFIEDDSAREAVASSWLEWVESCSCGPEPDNQCGPHRALDGLGWSLVLLSADTSAAEVEAGIEVVRAMLDRLDTDP